MHCAVIQPNTNTIFTGYITNSSRSGWLIQR